MYEGLQPALARVSADDPVDHELAAFSDWLAALLLTHGATLHRQGIETTEAAERPSVDLMIAAPDGTRLEITVSRA